MKINQTSDGQGLGLGTQVAPVELEFKTTWQTAVSSEWHAGSLLS